MFRFRAQGSWGKRVFNGSQGLVEVDLLASPIPTRCPSALWTEGKFYTTAGSSIFFTKLKDADNKSGTTRK